MYLAVLSIVAKADRLEWREVSSSDTSIQRYCAQILYAHQVEMMFQQKKKIIVDMV